MIKRFFTYLLFPGLLLASCSNSERDESEYADETVAETFEDGTYCADVEYYNPNTGTRSDYTLKVDVENNELVRIYFGNGGWLDSDHMTPQELDENGECTITSDRNYEYAVNIKGKDCFFYDKLLEEEAAGPAMFKVSELIKMLSYNPDEIDTYLLSKGYRLHLNDNNNVREALLYKYFNDDGSSDYSITYTKFKPGFQSKMSLGWSTVSEQDYVDIKNELKGLGFEFKNSNTTENTTYFTYKKGNIWAGLQVGIVEGTRIYTIDIREIVN
jgi:hypothetical protein